MDGVKNEVFFIYKYTHIIFKTSSEINGPLGAVYWASIRSTRWEQCKQVKWNKERNLLHQRRGCSPPQYVINSACQWQLKGCCNPDGAALKSSLDNLSPAWLCAGRLITRPAQQMGQVPGQVGRGGALAWHLTGALALSVPPLSGFY